MSRRIGKGLLALMAIGGWSSVDAGAQVLETEESLVARIETLAPLVATARLEAEAAKIEREARARALAEAAMTLDTLHLGDMTILTPVEDAALATEIFEAAWAQNFQRVESASLPHWTFTFQSGSEHPSIFVDSDVRSRRIEIEWWQSREDAIAIVASAIGHAVTRDLFGTNVGDWSASDPLVHHDPAALYRILATTASTSVRECMAGDAMACGTSLDLGQDATPEAWYTPEERRALALWGGIHATTQARRRELAERYRSCAEGHDYARCDGLLAVQQRDLAPLPRLLRASLIGMALERGGEGAWTRLIETSDGPVEAALAHTAGVEVDRLVADWRTWIIDNRPDTYASLAGNSALVTLWIVFFAFLAMRSTRWRLG